MRPTCAAFGFTRAILSPARLCTLLVLDLVFVFTWPPYSPEGLILRTGLMSRECVLVGPVASVVENDDGIVLRDGHSLGCAWSGSMVSRRFPYMVGSEPDVEQNGLWFPWRTRIKHVLWTSPSTPLPADVQAQLRAKFCEFIARGGNYRAYVPCPNYAAMLAQGDGWSSIWHPWACAHDGLFAVLAILAPLSLLRSWFAGRDARDHVHAVARA